MIKIKNNVQNDVLFADVKVGQTFMQNNLVYIRLRSDEAELNVWCFSENRLGRFLNKETVDCLVDCTLTVDQHSF